MPGYIMCIFCNICKASMGQYVTTPEEHFEYIGEWIKEYHNCVNCVNRREERFKELKQLSDKSLESPLAELEYNRMVWLQDILKDMGV